MLLKKEKIDYQKIESLERELFPELYPDIFQVDFIPPGRIGCVWIGRVSQVSNNIKTPITLIYAYSPQEIFKQLNLDTKNSCFQTALQECISKNTRLVDKKGNLRPCAERKEPIKNKKVEPRYIATLSQSGQHIISLQAIK